MSKKLFNVVFFSSKYRKIIILVENITYEVFVLFITFPNAEFLCGTDEY